MLYAKQIIGVLLCNPNPNWKQNLYLSIGRFDIYIGLIVRNLKNAFAGRDPSVLVPIDVLYSV